MRRLLGSALVATALAASVVPGARAAEPAPDLAADPAASVDPLIGTWAPGFVNPGPVLPHGMVGLGPDTEGPFNYGGYLFHNTTITGFSHVHLSAGVPQGGQVPFMPVTGDPDTRDLSEAGWPNPVPAYASPFTHATERAEPGFYGVRLDRYGVDVELTATERAGFHRYTFGAGDEAAVVVDAGRDLKGRHPATVSAPDSRTLTGSVTTDGPDHTVHFFARFDRPFAAELADGRAVLRFGRAGVVRAKVGISYVDRAGARRNLDAEIPGWDFDAVRRAARARWNEALGRVEVEGGTDAERRSFTTALYHALLFPNLFSDVDGRYVGFDDVVHRAPAGAPQYTQFSLWDSYRGQNQLLATIEPDVYADMVTSLLRDAEQGGRLPRWALANRAPDYMSGDPVIPFVGEAWCRGLLDGPTRRRLRTEMAELVADRHPTYLARGFQPTPVPASPVEVLEGGPRDAGTTLEYGVAEFALALMTGDLAMADRSTRGYRSLLDPDSRWIRPRHEDGSWLQAFAPENGYGFQEGTSWQYSWLVPHDLRGLYDGMGGDAVVQQRLDTFFALPPRAQNQITLFGLEYRGNQYAPGNEHDLHAPFLYTYAGAPWKTQRLVRDLVDTLFTPTPDGLPGNDDLGALSGWLVWAMLGLGPVTPGAPLHTIGSPVFERATLHLPGGDLVIDAPGASPTAPFVRSAALDGAPLERAWVRHDELTGGATLRLDVGPVPDARWGADPASAPPSWSTHDLAAFGCRSGA